MMSQKDVCIIILCVIGHVTLARPNVAHAFIILDKEIFNLVCVPNAFGAILNNHSFPAIFLFSVKMLSKASFWRRCNPNFHISIITMILSNTTNK